jgi:uncharacterized membrane protein (UPF0127 family)
VIARAAIGLVLVVAGCGSFRSPDSAASPGWATATIWIDERPLTVAVADDPARGLRDVDDLGDLDGMLFAYAAEVDPADHRFTMQGVRFPLDVAFFDGSGRLIEVIGMPVCASAPCPTYASPSPFRWALESPAGSVDLDPGARLTTDP